MVFLSICVATLFSAAAAQVRQRVIELPVDHFNVLNRERFDARYFVNGQHWIPGGVIFIYVTGGLELYDEFLTSGMMFELAQETNSYLFTMEQRYFGDSRPRQDLRVENLQFLTMQQSVADIATLVSFIRANYYGATNSRVILWGRGYGGNLAVFARQKYPHLVDAVWASSAPLNMGLEYPQLLSNTYNTFNTIGGPECGSVISGAFQALGEAIRRRDTSEIESRMRFCDPIETSIEEDVAFVFYSMATDLAMGFLSTSSYTEISDSCDRMTGRDDPENPPENDVDGFARWFVDGLLRDRPCLSYNRTAILELVRDESYDSYSNFFGTRQMIWVYCTQQGQFPTSNRGIITVLYPLSFIVQPCFCTKLSSGTGHPFGWGYERDFFTQWCADAFGHDVITSEFMEDSIAESNVIFGGLDQRIYRVFYTHGELDPRHNLGPNADLNDKAPVVVMSCEFTLICFSFSFILILIFHSKSVQSFGRDFGSPSETDYAVLIETKETVRELLIEWVFDAISEQPTPSPPVSPLNDIIVDDE